MWSHFYKTNCKRRWTTWNCIDIQVYSMTSICDMYNYRLGQDIPSVRQFMGVFSWIYLIKTCFVFIETSSMLDHELQVFTQSFALCWMYCSPQTSAKFKNEWNCIFTAPLCLQVYVGMALSILKNVIIKNK
jgi:hypothetical protein